MRKLLNFLEIENFRCFERLTVEKLGRVNLFVGKNSVGKTAVLEALWLLATHAAWPVIHKILYDRNELVIYNMPEQSTRSLQLEAVQSFFPGRSKNSSKSFDIAYSVMGSEKMVFYFKLSLLNNGIDVGLKTQDGTGRADEKTSQFPDLLRKEVLEYNVIEQSKKSKCVFVPLKGLTWQAVSSYWDDIALTDKEESIISCLKKIDKDATRFTFKGDNMQDRVRYSVLKTDRFVDPLPLATMGEGIQRVFALALAMSASSGKFLLIDEIETGLHHSVQAEIWRAVFKLAKEWDVQVFATTHSWDCIEAFQEAAAEDQNEEAMLISLQQRKAGIKAVLFDESDLKVVTRGHIEVR